MRDLKTLQKFLYGAGVDAAVLALRPDYRAVLLAVDGLAPRKAYKSFGAKPQRARAAWKPCARAGEPNSGTTPQRHCSSSTPSSP